MVRGRWWWSVWDGGSHAGFVEGGRWVPFLFILLFDVRLPAPGHCVRAAHRHGGRARRDAGAGIDPAVGHVPATPPTTSGDYLGSKACARCHQKAYDEWERSLHIRMTKPMAEATVVGDFRRRAARVARTVVRVRPRNDKPFMKIAFGGRSPETFQVDHTLGFKRYQGYLSTLPDGRMYVLPAFWHVETKRWIDWKEITPIPDGAHDLRQIWNTNCFNCHATNLAQGFDRDEGVQHDVDGDGHRLRSLPRPRAASCRADRSVAEEPGIRVAEAGRNARASSRRPTRAAAADLRLVRLLSRQQAERVRRFPRRRSLRGLRDAVSHQHADSRQRSRKASSGRTAGRIVSTARRR